MMRAGKKSTAMVSGIPAGQALAEATRLNREGKYHEALAILREWDDVPGDTKDAYDELYAELCWRAGDREGLVAHLSNLAPGPTASALRLLYDVRVSVRAGGRDPSNLLQFLRTPAYRALGDALAGELQLQLARLLVRIGRRKQVEPAIKRARSLFLSAKDAYRQLNVDLVWSGFLLDQGRWNEAEGVLKGAYAQSEKLGYARLYSLLATNRGNLHLWRGDFDDAEFFLRTALRIAAEREDLERVALAHLALALLHLRQGSFQTDERAQVLDRAEGHLLEAHKTFEGFSDGNRNRGLHDEYLGELRLVRGQLPEAILALRSGESFGEKHGAPDILNECRCLLADALVASGSIQEARDLAHLALTHFQNADAKYETARCRRVRAYVLLAEGQSTAALAMLRAADRTLAQLGERVERSRVRMLLAADRDVVPAIDLLYRLPELLSFSKSVRQRSMKDGREHKTTSRDNKRALSRKKSRATNPSPFEGIKLPRLRKDEAGWIVDIGKTRRTPRAAKRITGGSISAAKLRQVFRSVHVMKDKKTKRWCVVTFGPFGKTRSFETRELAERYAHRLSLSGAPIVREGKAIRVPTRRAAQKA